MNERLRCNDNTITM